MREAYKLNVIKNDTENELSDEDIGAQFGYNSNLVQNESDEVTDNETIKSSINDVLHRINQPTCSYINPVPSQLLTVFTDIKNKIPIHIELDSGASLNYCEEKAVKNLGFNISYNKQVSKLGDGVTQIESVGEINEIFYRNNWTVNYKAVVCKKLSIMCTANLAFISSCQCNKFQTRKTTIICSTVAST